jgi:P-type conjugative transfer protein TrbL
MFPKRDIRAKSEQDLVAEVTKMHRLVKSNFLILGMLLLLAFYAGEAHADISSKGVMDDILLRYKSVAASWETTISTYASWLFWTLALISMVWTFGLMALRQADIAEFFAEFIRFTIFTGFYWWLLTNGPRMAVAIMDSMREIGGTAAGTGSGMSPSGIVDVGFDLFINIADKSSIWHPVDFAVGMIIGAVILVVLALISVNMMLLLISSWILAYAGIFFLGFGGSRWTSDMALNYFRTVLSTGAQLLTMVLLVGIGKSFLDAYYLNMSGIVLSELGIILVISVVLLVLVNKLPGLVGGLAMGGGTGALGSGLGAGSVMAGAAMTAAAVSTAGSALMGAAASIGGGAQALMAAISKGSAMEDSSVAGSRDFFPGQAGGGTQGSGTGESSFSQTMGNDAPSSSGSAFAESAIQGTSQSSNSVSGGNGSGSSGKASTASLAGARSASSSPGAKAARVATGAASSLVGGIAQVAKNSLTDRVANTLGGRIANAIRENGNGDKVGEGSNTLSAGKKGDFDPQAEVAAFRDRDKNDGNDSDPPKT